jgi:magnesium-transporting ATPase (P-type)
MESGAKIARDVSDVVLLKNDFGLVPRIIFEGENVIANLKFMNKLFLSKTLHAIVFAIMCVSLNLLFPLLPTSILIYSFLGTSLPSYVVAFFRREVTTGKNFWWEVLPDAIFAGLISAIVSMVNYYQNLTLDPLLINTIVMYTTLGFSLLFTLYQLWRDGFVVKLWQLATIFTVVGVVSILASIVPLVNNYYNVVFPGVGKLEEGLLVGIAGFVVYLLVQICWDQLIGNRRRGKAV